jgi:hypothetical protein
MQADILVIAAQEGLRNKLLLGMRRMKKLVAALVLLGAILALWFVLWFIAAQRAESAVASWIEEEKSRDRQWACDQRSLNGFPLRLQINCASPAFRSNFGPIRSSIATHFSARASLFRPFDIEFKLDGPLKLAGSGGNATIHLGNFEGKLRAHAQSRDMLFQLMNVRIEEATGEAAPWKGSGVQQVDFRIQPSPDRAPGSDTQLLTIGVEGANLKPLDGFFGNEDPIAAKLSAIIINAGSASHGTLGERIDLWSASGGRIQIGALNAEKGPSRLDASGELTLDERRRPAGKLSVRLTGVQTILAALKIPAAPLAIEGLLRGSGGRGGANLIENRSLPLELRDGRLFVGPFRTPVVVPPLL